MFKADRQHTTSFIVSRRRVLLSGAAVAGAAALPVALTTSTHPDAELLAACAEYGDAGGARTGLFAASDRLAETVGTYADVPEEFLAPLSARLDAAEGSVINIEAKTLAGVVARARALVATSPNMVDPSANSGGRDEDVARAIIRDLLTVTGGAA